MKCVAPFWVQGVLQSRDVNWPQVTETLARRHHVSARVVFRRHWLLTRLKIQGGVKDQWRHPLETINTRLQNNLPRPQDILAHFSDKNPFQKICVFQFSAQSRDYWRESPPSLTPFTRSLTEWFLCCLWPSSLSSMDTFIYMCKHWYVSRDSVKREWKKFVEIKTLRKGRDGGQWRTVKRCFQTAVL